MRTQRKLQDIFILTQSQDKSFQALENVGDFHLLVNKNYM